MLGREGIVVGIALAFTASMAAPPVSAQNGPICPIDENGRVAEVFYEATALYWQPFVAHERLRLSVITPCGTIEKTYERGETASFDLSEVAGDLEGQYSWELRVDPVVDPAVRQALDAARAENDPTVPLQLQQKGLLPTGPLVDSGAFTVLDGRIVDPSGQEERGAKSSVAGAGLAPSRAGNGSVAFASDGLGTAGAPLTRATAFDQVIPDDLIVQGSECVGFDCVNNETFEFDTIRMKENSTRIKFMDTSTSGFPNVDWQLRANESASGGLNAFFIDEMGTGNTTGQTPESSPLILEANSPTNAIRVKSNGRVGFRTANPILDLHVTTSNTPGLRLEQTSAGGFTAQTWDVAGNEANFFVRDVNSGSLLPFRIRPGAPTSSIDISSSGNVGVGTASPGAAVDVRRNGSGSSVTFLRLSNTNGPARIEFRDDAMTNVDWDFRTTSGDTFVITKPTSPSNDFLINSAGNVTIRGTVTTSGPTCGMGCDEVFDDGFQLPSIEEHAAEMWAKGFLPAVGPTVPKAPFDVVEKTGGILHELEKAHIYIEQLHRRNRALEDEQQALRDELAALRDAVAALAATSR